MLSSLMSLLSVCTLFTRSLTPPFFYRADSTDTCGLTIKKDTGNNWGQNRGHKTSEGRPMLSLEVAEPMFHGRTGTEEGSRPQAAPAPGGTGSGSPTAQHGLSGTAGGARPHLHIRKPPTPAHTPPTPPHASQLPGALLSPFIGFLSRNSTAAAGGKPSVNTSPHLHGRGRSRTFPDPGREHMPRGEQCWLPSPLHSSFSKKISLLSYLILAREFSGMQTSQADQWYRRCPLHSRRGRERRGQKTSSSGELCSALPLVSEQGLCSACRYFC